MTGKRHMHRRHKWMALTRDYAAMVFGAALDPPFKKALNGILRRAFFERTGGPLNVRYLLD
jgi:hypothetical protein